MRMRWSSVRRSMSASECSSAPTSSALGCSTWRREKASSLPVSSAPRRERARRRGQQLLARSASSASAGSSSSTCRLPWMTVSRLLKSCAMPPVSWPTLSRRCACFERVLGLGALQAGGQQVGQRLEEALFVVAEALRQRASTPPAHRWCGRGRTAAPPAALAARRPRSAAGTAKRCSLPDSSARPPVRPCCSTKPGSVSGWLGTRMPMCLAVEQADAADQAELDAVAVEQEDHRRRRPAAPRRRPPGRGPAPPAGRARPPPGGPAAPGARCSGRAAAPAARAGRRRCRGWRRRRRAGRWSCSGLSAISTITSLPSLRRATSSICVPIGRERGAWA